MDDLQQWKRAGIETIVSLLTDPERADLALADEPELCAKLDLEFISFPIQDRSIPESRVKAVSLIQNLSAQMQAEKAVLLHCRMGIGRTGMIAVGVLVQLGSSVPDAIRRTSIARGLDVPETPEQIAWLNTLSDALKFEKH